MFAATKTQVLFPTIPSHVPGLPGHPSHKGIGAPGDHSALAIGWVTSQSDSLAATALPVSTAPSPQEIDPLYLFARHVEWEQDEEPSAGWDLLAAGQSSHAETRAHARALLASSRHFGGSGMGRFPESSDTHTRILASEMNMKAPYGLEIIDNCAECDRTGPGFFCGLSKEALHSLNRASHKSVVPAGAILFVEGQTPRGLFIICSGKVNLSTTSREGKVLILRTADAGEAVGLSAAISNVGYETTAETATPCQLNFVERKEILELLASNAEVGTHVVHCLSRDFQSAYRDIHHLVLNRTSAGRLARLLLSHSIQDTEACEARVHSSMTHEEMAQRIGSSRETVTRLLSDLRKRRLIRSEGPTLVIRDRIALEALAV